MDEAGFDPEAVDEEGLPLVYNEQRIAEYWAGRRAVLLSRWTSFASISGAAPLPVMCCQGECGKSRAEEEEVWRVKGV